MSSRFPAGEPASHPVPPNTVKKLFLLSSPFRGTGKSLNKKRDTKNS